MMKGCITVLLFLLAALLALRAAGNYKKNAAPQAGEETAKAQDSTAEEQAQAQPSAEKPAQKQEKTSAGLVLYSVLGCLTGAAAAYTVGFNTNLFPLWLAFVALGEAAWIDKDLRIIPNEIPLAMLVGSAVHLVLVFFANPDMLLTFTLSCLVSGVVSFALMSLLCLLAHGGFGAGDAKILGALGTLCGGVCVLGTLFFATLTAAVYAVVLLVQKKATLKYSMPFGPFLFLGFILAVAIGIC